LLWGMEEPDPAAMPIVIRGLSGGRCAGEVLYALETSEVGGVFAVGTGDGTEQRLFHSADCRLEHLCAGAGHDLIACSVHLSSGTAGIAVMNADGSDLREVTEGDSLDLAPSWVPGEARQLVFQSAGIGRDGEGNPVGVGPFAVQRLDLERGAMEEIAADPACDLLSPRLDPQGQLHVIRRPYQPARRGSVWRALLDFLLFPLRLVFAILQWFNFFTARYTGRPLTTAGGPKRQGADIRQMMVWGNLIDAEQAAREGKRRGEEAPDLVPASWQLVRKGRSGAEQMLAKGVLAYDLAADGTIVYTNGSAIFRIDPAGQVSRLHADSRIEHLALVPE